MDHPHSGITDPAITGNWLGRPDGLEGDVLTLVTYIVEIWTKLWYPIPAQWPQCCVEASCSTAPAPMTEFDR